MQKWLILLAGALLINGLHAQAEGDIYFTNNEDRYYHLEENCDRPAETNWWDGAPVEYYAREIYQKAPISQAAALEFGKTACPVCVKEFTPVYLGDHFPEWKYDAAPWEISGLDPELQQEFWKSRPQAFIDEIVATDEAFDAYYAEIYNHVTGQAERRHAYPAAYAGQYSGNSRCSVYQIVDPDAEIMAAFEGMFGGGAWIVPAKYGYDEIMEARDRVVQELIAWCEDHPEVDARWNSAGGPDYENCAVIGINGADWQLAAAAMEETAPIYIHFTWEESLHFVSEELVQNTDF